MRLGEKEWWIEHIERQNALSGSLEIRDDPSCQEYNPHCLRVVRKNTTHAALPRGVTDEKLLKDAFLSTGLFDRDTVKLEESIKLGNYKGQIDILAVGFDESQWVIECKIVEEKRDAGERKRPINIIKMASAIGQALLYTASYARKYPSQHFKVMPAVCTWALGSGSSQVIDLCKSLGITVFNIGAEGEEVRIFFLDGETRTSFA